MSTDRGTGPVETPPTHPQPLILVFFLKKGSHTQYGVDPTTRYGVDPTTYPRVLSICETSSTGPQDTVHSRRSTFWGIRTGPPFSPQG